MVARQASDSVPSPAQRVRTPSGISSSVLFPVLIIAAVTLLVHLALSNRFGFHRDELYYLASARHLAFGYVDNPPIVPLIARLVAVVTGEALWPLRVIAGASHVATVVIAGLIARELGGHRWAIGVTAAAIATSPIFMATGSMFQTVVFEHLWAALALLLVTRLLNGEHPRLWLAVGLVFGVGLQTKWTIALVATGLAVGFLIVPEARRHLRAPWPWIGIAIAILLWLPNLIWQATNGWPTLEFARNNNVNVQDEGGRIAFVLEQFLLIGPLAVPIFVAGLVWLWHRSPRRSFAIAAATMFFILLVVGGKSYYLASIYVIALAGGAVAAEAWASSVSWRRTVVIALIAVNGLVSLPIVAPITPHQVYADVFHNLNDEMGEQLGWPELVDQVAVVYLALPTEERTNARILTASYGEAAAIDLFGPVRGIPRGTTISGHNSYFHWWPDDEPAGPVISVRYLPEQMSSHFGDVEEAGKISNPWQLENETFGAPILVLREPLSPPERLRDLLRHYD
jgi:hypothetical protein